MIVPYFPPDEDIMSTATDVEREKFREFDSIRRMDLNLFDKRFHQREPSIVLDGFLFLGSLDHATDRDILQQCQIKHILNVCDISHDEKITNNFNVTHIPICDYPDANIKQHFDRTNELLRGFYEKNECCLVHCAAGISRSATVVLAYLMKYHHNTLKEAYVYLAEKRPQICPNEGFLLQLIRYENELIKSREINVNDTNKNEENPIETLNEYENKHKNDNV